MGAVIAVGMIVLGAGAIYVGITGSQGKVWDLVTGKTTKSKTASASPAASGGTLA